MTREYPYPPGGGKVRWISTEWLEDKLEQEMTILDVQPNIHDYLQEHIPGAVYLNEGFFRAYQENKPGVFMSPKTVQPYLRKVGLSRDKPVVVYTGKGPFKGWGDGLEQTVVAYSLAKYGHDQVLVLDGGMEKWKKEGREINQIFPVVDETDFVATDKEGFHIAYEEVRRIKDEEDVILLDARPPHLYEGQGPWGKPGHIPGAVNLPWAGLMMKDNPRQLKPEEEIREIIESKGISREKGIICSCGTGREATNEFLLFNFALRFPKVWIYEGSFTEWSSYPENPTVTGPDPY